MFFLKNLCFLCLRDDQKHLKDIFHLDDNKNSIQNKLEYCMTELMNFNFEIPKLICVTCQQYLDFVYIFKLKCIKNNIRLKTYIDQLQPNKSLDDDKYQNLQVCVSDIPIKSLKLKLEVPDQIPVEKSDFGNKAISQTYVPLQDCELSEECNIVIKEEFVVLDESESLQVNEILNSQEIDYDNVTNTYQDAMLGASQELFISEACQNIIYQDYIDNSNNIVYKQTDLILASDSQNLIFEIDSSVLEIKDGQQTNEKLSSKDLVDSSDDKQKIKSFDVYKIKRDKVTGKYHCTFCDKSYNKTTVLDIHLRKFHIEDKPFHCKVCPAKFQFRSKLNSHINKAHDDTYECTICNKKYARKNQLTKHLQLHAEKAYQCEVCCKKFRRKYHYTNHLTTHTGEKAFDCRDCGKKFSTIFNLAVHSRVHSGVKPYVCSICGKAFSTWVHRRSHMDSHNDYRRYACTICPSRFIYRSNLRDHMKVHSDEKQFPCDICEKRFKKKWHLSEHTKTHSRSRARVTEKIKCDICQKVCAKGAGMKNHMKMHDTN